MHGIRCLFHCKKVYTSQSLENAPNHQIYSSIHVLPLALMYYSKSPSIASNLSVAIVYVLGPLTCAHLSAHELSLNAVVVLYGYPVALLELRYYAMSCQVQTNISLTTLCFNKYAFA